MEQSNQSHSPPSLETYDSDEANVILSELSDESKLKLEILQSLLEPCGLA